MNVTEEKTVRPGPAHPLPPSSSGPSDGGASVDVLAERLRALEGVNDDLASLLAQNWQKLLSCLVLVLLGVWISHEYRNNRDRNLGEASERFTGAQKIFASLASGTAAENEQRAFEDSLSALQEGFSRSVYARLAKVYEGALLLRQGKPDAALDALSAVDTGALSSGNTFVKVDTVDDRVFIAELASLVKARALLASENTTKKEEGRRLLKQLVYRASIVNSEAMLVLLRLAATPEERSDAGELADALLVARPELAAGLKTEAQALGYQLKAADPVKG